MSNPHYGPAHPQPAAPPPRKKRTGLIVLVIVSALLLTLIGACAAVISSISNAVNGVSASEGPVVVDGDDSEAPAEEDSPKADEPADRNGGEKKAEKKTEKAEQKPFTIKATKCKRRAGGFGMVDIKVKVTNHTDQKMTYLFDISVEDTDGNVVGSGGGSIDNVRPGKSGTAATFVSMTDDEYDGKIKCVIDVTDFSDF